MPDFDKLNRHAEQLATLTKPSHRQAPGSTGPLAVELLRHWQIIAEMWQWLRRLRYCPL